MQIGIANGIPLNDVITGDDLVPAYDQSTGTEGYVNLTTAVQKAFSGSVAGTANGVLYLDGSKVATSGSALTFDGSLLNTAGSVRAQTSLLVYGSGDRLNVFPQAAGSGVLLLATNNANSAYAPLTLDGSATIFNASGGEQMRLTSTGLGIGTSSPVGKLRVVTDPALASTDGFIVNNNGVGNRTAATLYYFTGDGSTAYSGQISPIDGGGLSFRSGSRAAVGSETFTERMVLSGSGNLGLGVTPSSWSSGKAFELGAVGNALWGYSGNVILSQNTAGYAGSFLYATTAAASRYQQTAGTHTWYTAPSGTAGNPISFTQAMTLDANGNLLVGTTSSGAIAAGGVVLGNLNNAIGGAVSGGILTMSGATTTSYVGLFSNPNGAVGSITIAGSTTAYNTSSDYRLKDITGPITNSGAYIDSLNPVEGTWKADGSTFVGLIAHEVQEVSRTQVATGEKDGEQMQAMDYSNSELIANLIAEVKSLRARVAALESN